MQHHYCIRHFLPAVIVASNTSFIHPSIYRSIHGCIDSYLFLLGFTAALLVAGLQMAVLLTHAGSLRASYTVEEHGDDNSRGAW